MLLLLPKTRDPRPAHRFDIRQWVCVTSWQPLEAWLYDEPYVRFAAEEYDAEDLITVRRGAAGSGTGVHGIRQHLFICSFGDSYASAD